MDADKEVVKDLIPVGIKVRMHCKKCSKTRDRKDWVEFDVYVIEGQLNHIQGGVYKCIECEAECAYIT